MTTKTDLPPIHPKRAEDLVRVLWFGDPGMGKTTAAAGVSAAGKTILLDSERRFKRSALRRSGVNVDNIEVYKDTSYVGINALLSQVEDRIDSGEPIAAFIWDGITEGQRVLLQGLVDAGVESATLAGRERNEWRTYQEDYGDVTEQMRRLIRRVNALPVHVGITSLAKREQDENGVPRVSANLTPAVLRDLHAAMDIIVFLKVEDVAGSVERFGMCQPLGAFDAKDTFGVLPRRLVEPSFERVLLYTTGALTSANDPLQEAARQRSKNQTTPKQEREQ